MTPDLTDAEIDAICAGLVQNHAKVLYLQRLGLTVRRKPNGKPLVNRAHYDAVMNPSAQPSKSFGRAPAWSVA
jgi:hypothetical protein